VLPSSIASAHLPTLPWRSNQQPSSSIFPHLRMQLGWTLFLPTYVLTSIWPGCTTLLEHSCYSIHVVSSLCDVLLSFNISNLAWSVTMACYAHGTPISTVWTYVGLFLAAAQVFHAAGCVINDMWDKDVDAAVRECYTFSSVMAPRDAHLQLEQARDPWLRVMSQCSRHSSSLFHSWLLASGFWRS
jgi:hypothetical protein